MILRHRLDNRGCKEMDEEATAFFLSIAQEKGWQTVKARGKQDYEEHWDWQITKATKSYKVDLKSLKRVNSKDNNSTDELILIELQAVKTSSNAARKGWLYGLADYICFELTDSFIFVPRNKLQDYVESHIDITAATIPSNQNKVAHKIYTRRDREDKFVYFYKHEILPLTEAIWRKYV